MYPEAPPETVTLALPVVAPLHATLVCEVLAVKAVGCVITKVLTIDAPFASVIVQTYVPAVKPVTLAPVPTDGDQE